MFLTLLLKQPRTEKRANHVFNLYKAIVTLARKRLRIALGYWPSDCDEKYGRTWAAQTALTLASATWLANRATLTRWPILGLSQDRALFFAFGNPETLFFVRR